MMAKISVAIWRIGGDPPVYHIHVVAGEGQTSSPLLDFIMPPNSFGYDESGLEISISDLDLAQSRQRDPQPFVREYPKPLMVLKLP